MKFRPLHDRVLLKRVESEGKTAGGILSPDPANQNPMEAEVIACGPGAFNETGARVALDVKEGNRVLISKWAGTEISVDGQELLVVKESDIMGIIEGGAAAKKAA